jgi:hypothetical protein
MSRVTVTVENLSGNKVGFTLDEELDKERIEYLRKLVRREELASLDVQPVGEKPKRATRGPNKAKPAVEEAPKVEKADDNQE